MRNKKENKYLIKSSKNLSIAEDREVVYESQNENNVYQIINAIRKGINYKNFEILVREIPLSISEWSDNLHLNARTMLRYKTDNKTFDNPQTERIYQISRLYKKGLEVFEDKKNFDAWLNAKNIVLGNVTPKSLFDSSYGINLVNDTLIRIEHGVLA